MNVAKDMGDWYLELEDDNPPNDEKWSPKIRSLEWEKFGILSLLYLRKHRNNIFNR